MKITAVKLFLIAICAALFLAFGFEGDVPTADAASSGPSPAYTNAPGEQNCTLCHISYDLNIGKGNVTINGIPPTYTSGQQIPVTVTVSQGDAIAYGFQMTSIDSTGARAGLFSFPMSNAELQIRDGLVEGNLRDYIEHTSQGITPTQFGSKSWDFIWIAPNESVGRVDFYATGNGANSDLSSGGDYIYSTTDFATPASSTFSVGGQVTTPSGGGLRNTIVSISAPGFAVSNITNSFGFFSFPNVPAGSNYTVRVASRRYRFANQQISVSGNLSNVNFVGLE